MNMKVLHVISHNSPMLANYVSMITNISGIISDTTDHAEEIKHKCTDFLPDIIHLHGCNNAKINKIISWAQQQSFRIVVTPHGQLESWEDGNRSRVLKHIIEHSYVVIARSQTEQDELKRIGWNSRTEIIPNPIITRTTTADKLSDAHQKIYSKILNSNVLELLDEETEKALHSILKAGICGDGRWAKPFHTEAVNWKLLYTYVEQEGITSYYERGLFALQLLNTEHQSLPSYLPKNYRQPKSLAGKSLSDIVRNAHQQVTEGCLSLLTLADLHAALLHDDVEDDVVVQQLENEGLSKFMASLMTVMKEQTGLDEGYMPCWPVENKMTEQIRQCIIQHLEI